MTGQVRDYHVHTTNSIDGRARMKDYCQLALQKGVAEIVFTEHFDLHHLEEGRNFFDYDSYSREIEDCRRRYDGSLIILKGLELGEPHLYTGEHAAYLADKDFDFLLGSVHWIADEALHIDYCGGKRAREAYHKYFLQVLEAAAKGNFDVLGHLDLLKRYAPREFGPLKIGDYREIIEEILKKAVERGIGLEINTSGWRQGLGEPLPSEEILTWYRQLGGEIITVGSDSHRGQFLGYDIRRAYRLMRRLGFQWLTVFRGRKPRQLPLEQWEGKL